MSAYNHQGPILPKSPSKSNHSLYSDRSDLSLSPPKVVITNTQNNKSSQQKLQRTKFAEIKSPKAQNNSQQLLIVPKVKILSEKQVSKLPQIKIIQPAKTVAKSKLQKLTSNSFTNDAVQRHALFNQKQSSVEIKEQKAVRGQLFSVSENRRQKSFQRYGQLDTLDEDNQKKKLGTSQANRWSRIQSLAISREQRNFKYFIRHFHKHNSIMVEALNRFWQFFESIQQFYSCSAYKISLHDSLQAIKLKMQNFLQRKINLDNFQSEKPSPDWTQQQFMKFYGNYKRILLTDNNGGEHYHRPYTLKKYKNCVFFGQMADGKKQEGILHYFDGKCFQGKFKDDQKHHGLQIDQKELYLGTFKKGLKNGEGILKTTEALFAGAFTYGQFTTVSKQRQQSVASSLFVNKKQEIYNSTSQYKRGFQIQHSSIKIYDKGSCIIKNNQGDIFIGLIGEDGEKQDEGLQLFANGDIYIGKYEAGSPEGYGQYYWQNGSNYRGQFLSGMRHGRGVWQMINGDSYEGEYMNDKKNGKGIYIWKNGSKYQGNFQNDYRHGYGEMKWQDGRTYKGQWLNGIQKNTLIALQKPQAKTINLKATANRTAFRTLQNDKRKKIPLDKLKSLYNPSYH